MTAAKRATATITDAELIEVASLTYREAADALGIGSTATIRLLYQSRGVHRPYRAPGELAPNHTRAKYRQNGSRRKAVDGNNNAVPGIHNGARVKLVWDTMDAGLADLLGLTYVCRQFGTEHCLKHCELQIAVPDCDLLCHKCEFEQRCPCSLWSYRRRRQP